MSKTANFLKLSRGACPRLPPPPPPPHVTHVHTHTHTLYRTFTAHTHVRSHPHKKLVLRLVRTLAPDVDAVYDSIKNSEYLLFFSLFSFPTFFYWSQWETHQGNWGQVTRALTATDGGMGRAKNKQHGGKTS